MMKNKFSIEWKSKLKKYGKYKRYLNFLSNCLGISLNCPSNTTISQIILRSCSIFISAYFLTSILLFDFIEVTSLDTFTRSLGPLIAMISTLSKTCILIRCQDDLRYLNKNITSSFEQDIRDPKLQEQALKKMPTFSNFCYFFTGFAGSTIVLMMLAPLYFASKGKYIRSYPQYLPFTIEPGGMRHWFLYGLEAYSLYNVWVVSGATDGIFGFYTLNIVGELKVLTKCFQNLSDGQSYKKDIKECVRRHKMIIESVAILQKIYGFLSILLAVTCSVAICALIFQFSKMQNLTLIRSCYLMTHLLTKLVQAFTSAWNGFIITTESEKCLLAVYESKWPGTGDKQFMNDLVIILSQKPLIFNAMYIMNLDFNMFSKVVRASMSYFFLLKTLEDNG